MAVISFSDRPDEIWCVAGWPFRQVLNDVMSKYPDDAEMADAFDHADALSGLIVDMLGRPLRAQRQWTNCCGPRSYRGEECGEAYQSGENSNDKERTTGR